MLFFDKSYTIIALSKHINPALDNKRNTMSVKRGCSLQASFKNSCITISNMVNFNFTFFIKLSLILLWNRENATFKMCNWSPKMGLLLCYIRGSLTSKSSFFISLKNISFYYHDKKTVMLECAHKNVNKANTDKSNDRKWYLDVRKSVMLAYKEVPQTGTSYQSQPFDASPHFIIINDFIHCFMVKNLIKMKFSNKKWHLASKGSPFWGENVPNSSRNNAKNHAFTVSINLDFHFIFLSK